MNQPSVFKDFTRKYALSKTLRFELKPEGKTLDNLRRAMRWDDNLKTFLSDQEIEDAYQTLKPVFDRLHEEFITSSLESDEAKEIDFSGYFEEYKKGKERKIEGLEKKLRSEIGKLYESTATKFKDENPDVKLDKKNYEILTEAKIVGYLKKRYKDEEKVLSALERIDKFFTYFGGFNQNRENYYATDEKAITAVANRIVSENLPKFCDNVLDFEKRRDEILGADDFLREKGIALIAKDQVGGEIELHKVVGDIFSIGYFVNCLSQKEIEKYNLEIGNANNLINRYNQQKSKDEGFKKLAKFKTLYKQIGCGERGEFIPEIKGDELKGIFEDIKNEGGKFFENAQSFAKLILGLESFEGVYWSEKALNTISAKYLMNWTSLKELLRDAKIFKKEKDEIKVPQTIELAGLLKVLDESEVEFKQTFKDNNVKKQEIVKRVELKNSQKLLQMILVDIEQNEEVFDDLKNKLPANDYKKDENTQTVKSWLDSLLNTNQILKYFKVRENKIKGSPLNTDVTLLLDKVLLEDNPNRFYDLVRNCLTKKPTEGVNKLKLNFENAVLAGGWDVNKEPERRCIILKDEDDRKYLVVLTRKMAKLFVRKDGETNLVYDVDNAGWQKMDYKLLPGPNKMLPKMFLSSKKWLAEHVLPQKISEIYERGSFKKGDFFDKDDLGELVNYFKDCLSKHEWGKTFDFHFSNTSDYESIDQFYNEVEKQGYKISWSKINKGLLDEKVNNGEVYLFEIRNSDNNLANGKKKISKQNLHTIYWNAVFGKTENKPKLNGEAEIFYRPVVEFEKKKDKNGKEFGADHKRFTEEKFVLHCPITLNFCLRSSRLNDEINRELVKLENKDKVCFIGIDRGEKHLMYYSVLDQNERIVRDERGKLMQGSFNVIGGYDYAKKLEETAGNRDEARKNWRTIGTIKELKDGYISQVVRGVVDLTVRYNAYIVLENLNTGFKRGRQKIEKQVYQKFELALAKKLNFVVDKDAKDGETGSVQNAWQLTPVVNNFSDIENAKQWGNMLYVRANYTSQTDPITGWRRKVYFKKTRQKDLVEEIKNSFSQIGFDGKDYYFAYIDKNTGKERYLWSGKNGDSLDRFRGEKDKHGIWKIEKQEVVVKLNEVFGKQTEETNNLKDKINENNVKTLKFAIDLIQQIRNTGDEEHKKKYGEDKNDFILSPVRDDEGDHFDSRKEGALVSNGDANGAYNIARKGLMAFGKIEKAVGEAKIGKDGKEKINYDLYIEDKEWDEWLVKGKELNE